MTTTTNFVLVNLENGDVAKETKINGNMAILDAKVPRALADTTAAPSVVGLARGTTYYNTTDNKVYWLRALTVDSSGAVATGSWIALT